MKPIEKTIKLLLAAAFIILLSMPAQAQVDRFYYAVEIDGILCGYSISDAWDTEYDGNPMIESRDTVILLLKALGQDMNLKIISSHLIQAEGFKVVKNTTTFDYEAGNVVSTETRVFNNYALRTELPRETADTIWLEGEVIFDNPLSSPHLIKDFIDGGATEKTYQIYDYILGDIATQDYTLEGEEKMHLAGKDFDVMVLNTYNHTNGTNVKMWVDKKSGMTLQFEIMNRKIYLADKSVIKKIKTVDLDNSIFGKTNENIYNFMDMTYLKVEVDIESSGDQLSVGSLNFPGQKFEGTVIENHIQGVFEIEPLRFDGTNAPAFPYNIPLDESFDKYIEPEMLIESDDPNIIAEAEAITAGSTDSWEAVVRLSEWVGKEISGAVPGGTSAINTYRIRQGECGSHSRLLAAFCRAVGIPSRLSAGCMYSTWYGGSFGQHAWTEVYLGDDIGWVAVDATILEYDYVDAGHIRLGTSTTFQPISMEILDYRIGDGEQSNNLEIPDEYVNIVGPYFSPERRDVLEAIYADGELAVDIKGRMTLALKDADAEGRRYAKLSNNLFFRFPENENGNIDRMEVVEKVFAIKKLDKEIVVSEETPEELKPFIGPYVIFQIQATFEAIWQDGKLQMKVPDVEEPKPLEKMGTDNWRDPEDLREYHFVVNKDGSVSGMNIFGTSVLNKGATAAWILENVIEKEGLEAAETEFNTLWDARALDLDHTEGDLNRLGYKYLGNDQLEEALLVFRLNTEAYPESGNAYDSYGEALLKSGDVGNAIINYQKSLELNPENTNAQEKLDELNITKQ